MITFPNKLHKNDKVGIVSPSYYLSPKIINAGVKLLESWGLNVLIANSVQKKHFEFSGNDNERLVSLQEMLDDKEIKCVFCARGGYGITRIIDKLDFSRFKKFPKWIIGYSDITAIHIKINDLGYSSIHGPMVTNFKMINEDPSIDALKKFLFTAEMDPIEFNSNQHNIQGQAKGQITGGNLTLLTNNIGTKSEINTDKKLLFIEEIDEKLYKIDRMLVQLKRTGKLDNIIGLIIGYFTQSTVVSDTFGYKLEEVVLEHTADLGIPVAFNTPIGHELPNFPIPMEGNFKLEIGKQKSKLTFIN